MINFTKNIGSKIYTDFTLKFAFEACLKLLQIVKGKPEQGKTH